MVGSFMTDLVVTAPRRPRAGETLRGHDFRISLGGKGYNQAVAARRAGASVEFVGMVGIDDFGSDFLEGLRAEGIGAAHVLTSGRTGTGVGLPLVDDSGQNSIVIVPRANLELAVPDLDQARTTIESASVLLLQLELDPAVTSRAAQIAHAAGRTVLLNPAPFAPLDDRTLRDVDVLVPNEGEARSLAGTDDDAPLDQVVSNLRRRFHGHLVITLAEAGALIAPAGTTPFHLPAHEARVVDTVGAGDIFCGVLGAGLAEGLSLASAVRRSNAASALAIGRRGGAESAPSRAQIVALADAQGTPSDTPVSLPG